MIPSHLLPLLTQAEAGNEDTKEELDELLTVGDLEKMTMDEVYRVSRVCDDVSMVEFFEPRDMLESGFISEEEYDGIELAGCEEI